MKIAVLMVGVLLAVAGYNGVMSARYAQTHSSLVTEVQSLKGERDRINAEWTQLLLEQKMLADDSVVSHAVRQGMDMHLPNATQVVYLD